jgi:DNA ligase-1
MFRYQELSDGGVPRFPSFVREVEEEKAGEVIINARKKLKKEPPAIREPASVAAKVSASPGIVRYFELVDDKSSKFWEAGMSGTEVTVRYGRIGTSGTSKTKDLGSDEAASKHLEKLIDQKTAKGYSEVETSS